MSRFRMVRSALLAFAFSAAVPATVAIIQAPAAAIDQPEDVGTGGNRCRDCTESIACKGDVCSSTKVCGPWYNC